MPVKVLSSSANGKQGSESGANPNPWGRMGILRGLRAYSPGKLNLKFVSPAYQTFAFFEDDSAFVSHILLCFDYRRSTSVSIGCDR